MARLKKAFAWLVGNFPNTFGSCWIPLIVIPDFFIRDDPDGWDYGIRIILLVVFAIGLVIDVSTYRRKIAKKDLEGD